MQRPLDLYISIIVLKRKKPTAASITHNGSSKNMATQAAAKSSHFTPRALFNAKFTKFTFRWNLLQHENLYAIITNSIS